MTVKKSKKPELIMADGKWKKVLYKRSKYPDDYTSPDFLSDMQTNLHVEYYNLWEVILGASKLMFQIDVIVSYFCIFEFVQINALDFGQLSVSIALSFLVCETLFILYNLNSSMVIFDHLQTVITFLLVGFGFTPIIRTLTTTISTDTVYALSIIAFCFSLVFHDYGANVAMISAPLSTNLCLSASIFLISRITNDIDAFFMLTLSVFLFSFLPIIENYLFLLFMPLSLIFTLILGSICVTCLIFIVPELSVLLIIVHFIIVLFCPLLYVRMQHLKKTLHGPWQEAVLNNKK